MSDSPEMGGHKSCEKSCFASAIKPGEK